MAEDRDVSQRRTHQGPDPNEQLVKVFDAERESEALVVSGLLEANGIDCDVTSTDAAQNMYPGVGGNVVLVREDQAEDARRIIESYRRSPDETADIDFSEGPSQE
jgi:hypothetical protein